MKSDHIEYIHIYVCMYICDMEEARGETAPVAPQIKVVLRLNVNSGVAVCEYRSCGLGLQTEADISSRFFFLQPDIRP